MWRNVGIVRSQELLAETIEIINFWGRFVLDKTFDDRGGWETQNMLTVGRLIAAGATHRNESRGVHCRTDFAAEPDPTKPGYHVNQQRSGDRHVIQRDPVT